MCITLRLDWDQDSSKETSDIYIKFRLIMLAVTLVPFVYLKYLIHRSALLLQDFASGTEAMLTWVEGEGKYSEIAVQASQKPAHLF